MKLIEQAIAILSNPKCTITGMSRIGNTDFCKVYNSYDEMVILPYSLYESVRDVSNTIKQLNYECDRILTEKQ